MIKHLTGLMAVLLLSAFAVPAMAAGDVDARLAAVKKERQQVAAMRSRLEARLGDLGRELQRLDRARVEAQRQTREVTERWQQVKRELQALQRKQAKLQQESETLRHQMIGESVAAWQQARHQPGWLDVLAGVPVTEVPHRRYMLQHVMQAQQSDRERLQNVLLQLDEVARDLDTKQQQLAVARDEKRKAEAELAEKRKARAAMMARVRRDVALQKQRDRELAEQEQALKRLLDGLQLLASDKAARPVSVRKLRGKLPWPLHGKLAAGFHSRPGHGQPRLEGVQIVPRSQSAKGRKVRAIAGGQVRYADWFGGFGLMMIVEHGDGIMTIYAHNDALYKQLGDWVEPGEVLAEAGSTGWIDDVRLYFEVRDKGKPVNPARWCRR